jgi:hypothetical protein
VELRQLTEQAHRIRKLTEHPDWAVLVEYVQGRIEAEQRWLMNGHAKTVEDYRGRAGWVQGAMHVLEAPDRIDEEVKRAREEAA